jgi:hypothetical protein
MGSACLFASTTVSAIFIYIEEKTEVSKFGKCKLCWLDRELVESHFMPASICAVCTEPSLKNPHPVRIAGGQAVQKPNPVTDHVLCTECEDLFNKNGEAWMSMNIARVGSFPLVERLGSAKIIEEDETGVAYAGLTIPGCDLNKIEYFALSLFWRSSAHRWENRDKIPRIDLGPYEETIRQYLLGEADFPEDVSLLVSIWPLETIIGFYLPYTQYDQSFHIFNFYIPGFDFRLCIGKRVPADIRRLCCHSSADRLVVSSKIPNDNVRTIIKGAFDSARPSTKLIEFLTGPDPRSQRK